MIFNWSLSDSKSPPISRILLSTPVDFNNAVFWIVFSDFHSLQSMYQSFHDCTDRAYYNCCHSHFNAHKFFSTLEMSKNLSLFPSVLNRGTYNNNNYYYYYHYYYYY